MPPSERFMQLLDKMKEIHLAKNAGYAGNSPDPWINFKMSTMFGVKPSVGCLIRATDKMARIASLIQNPDHDKVGESILDSAVDLANYAIIFCCLYEGEQGDQTDTLKELEQLSDMRMQMEEQNDSTNPNI
jgi:hypothetical protein